jgi:tetratricopeptide (TPR) repeat protein
MNMKTPMSKFWSLTLLALFLPLLMLAQPGTKKYQEGRNMMGTKNYVGALAAFSEAVKLEPNNYRYWYQKGQAEEKLKKYNDAVASYKKCTELNKDFSQGYVKTANISMSRLKDYNGAIGALNSAFASEKDPGRKITYKNMVIKLLLKQNRPQDAMAELNAMKPLAAPDDIRVLNAEGDIYAAMNNWPKAVDAYQKAVAKSKDVAPAQAAKYNYNLGLAYYRSGDAKKAEETWKNVENTRYAKKVKSLMVQSGSRWFVLASSGYLKANVLDDAMEYANKAVQAEPNNPSGYKLLATIQIKKGQTALAISNLNKAAEFEKDEAKKSKLFSQMIKLQFNNGDYNGALATANKILAKSPNNATVLGLKSQAEYQLGQFANSIKSSDAAIGAIDKKDVAKAAPFWFTQGLAAKKSGDIERAKKAFQNANTGVFRAAAKIETDKIAAK